MFEKKKDADGTSYRTIMRVTKYGHQGMLLGRLDAWPSLNN
jgi:hypothetical protein